MIKLDLNPPAHQLRQFGWIALIGFPLVGYVITNSFDLPWTVFYVLAGLGALTLLLSLVDAKLIKPIYMLMTLIAIPIGFVISWLLMGLVYYGMFTPVGLVFRLMGRDVLHKHPDPDATTYWHDRGESPPAPSYFKTY